MGPYLRTPEPRYTIPLVGTCSWKSAPEYTTPEPYLPQHLVGTCSWKSAPEYTTPEPYLLQHRRLRQAQALLRVEYSRLASVYRAVLQCCRASTSHFASPC